MRDEYIYLIRKCFSATIFFVLAYYLQNYYPPQHPDIMIDFIIVSFFFIIPYIFYMIALKNVTDILIFLAKRFLLPVHFLEESIYSIKKLNIVYWIVCCLFLLIFAYIAPTFNNISKRFLEVESSNFFLNVFLFAMAGFVKNFPYFFLIAFVYHLITVALIRRTKIDVDVDKQFIALGDKTTVRIRFEYPLPIINIFPNITRGKVKKVRTSLFFEEYYMEFEGKETGFYLFDVFEIYTITFPIFVSKFYLKARKYGKVIVLPKIKLKAVRSIKNPYITRESGELIKKVYGSSLDFADIREYVVGDPPSRIWWKGYAKTGKLMTKEFYSFAEDRWIILLDLTEELTKEEREKLLSFVRMFIEVYTRKDIQISLHIFSRQNYAFIDYTSNMRELLSFLIKYYRGFKLISPKGIEKILSNAGINVNKVREVCNKEKISISSYLFYNGILKEKMEIFRVPRSKVIKTYIGDFIKNIRKYGKLLIVTKRASKEYEKIIGRITHYMIICLQPYGDFRYIVLRKPETVVYQLAYAF